MSAVAEQGRAAGRRESVAGLPPAGIRFLSVMVGLVAWEAYGRALHSVIFTYPSAVVRAGYELIVSGELQFYLKSSVIVLSLGLVLAIVLGIRLAIGRGLIGMVVAEFYTTITGLGYMIVQYANTFRMDRLFVPVVVLMIMGVVLTGVLRHLERRIAPWLYVAREE